MGLMGPVYKIKTFKFDGRIFNFSFSFKEWDFVLFNVNKFIWQYLCDNNSSRFIIATGNIKEEVFQLLSFDFFWDQIHKKLNPSLVNAGSEKKATTKKQPMLTKLVTPSSEKTLNNHNNTERLNTLA